MSEYQYYQFLALDQPLSEGDQKALRAISTRAEITRHSFTNVYHWGNLKARPDDLVDRYFDAHLYVTNWGTFSCQLRIPKTNLPPEDVAPYGCGDSLQVRATETHTVVTWTRNDEEPDDYWDEEPATLAGLIPLRTSLMQGDLRALYLGWLLGIQQGDVDDDDPEPPVPPGLQDPDGPLQALADFLDIDPDLLSAAAMRSPEREAIDREALRAWLATLPDETNDEWLLTVMSGGGAALAAPMWARFRQSTPDQESPVGSPGRTAGDLCAEADRQRLVREEREAREAAARQQAEAEARQRHLAALVGQESALWQQVTDAIAVTHQADYDLAVSLLADLRDLAGMSGDMATFSQGMAALRKQYSRRQGLWNRLREKGLY
jgi:hypothetical protein